MSDNTYETARITITRVLTMHGEDEHYVETSDDLGLLEALGMLRLAEDSLIQHPPAEDDEEP
jgi:hypothetical protein